MLRKCSQPWLYSLCYELSTFRKGVYPNRTSKDADTEAVLNKVHLLSLIRKCGGLDMLHIRDSSSRGEQKLFCLVKGLIQICTTILDEPTSRFGP